MCGRHTQKEGSMAMTDTGMPSAIEPTEDQGTEVGVTVSSSLPIDRRDLGATADTDDTARAREAQMPQGRPAQRVWHGTAAPAAPERPAQWVWRRTATSAAPAGAAEEKVAAAQAAGAAAAGRPRTTRSCGKHGQCSQGRRGAGGARESQPRIG